MQNQDNLLAKVVETLFVCILLFYRDLAMFIFPMVLAYFKDPITKMGQGPHPVDRVTLSPPPIIFL